MDPAALEQLVENFGDPRVGLVTATVHFQQPKGAVPEGQGMYWRYELLIRRAESDLGILAKASGQAIAVRRELFRPLQPCFGDDCILPLEVRVQGYRVVHEHRAVVTDTMPHTLEGEMKARIRMTARNWTGTLSQIAILNPLRFPVTSWALISHKVLRWLSPLFPARVPVRIRRMQGEGSARRRHSAGFGASATCLPVIQKGSPPKFAYWDANFSTISSVSSME